MVKFEFEIYKCEFCSFLLFLQGEFQEKLNKLESESESMKGEVDILANFLISTFLIAWCIVQWLDGEKCLRRICIDSRDGGRCF